MYFRQAAPGESEKDKLKRKDLEEDTTCQLAASNPWKVSLLSLHIPSPQDSLGKPSRRQVLLPVCTASELRVSLGVLLHCSLPWLRQYLYCGPSGGTDDGTERPKLGLRQGYVRKMEAGHDLFSISD